MRPRPNPAEKDRAGKDSAGKVPAGRSLRVLFVDDLADAREISGMLLQAQGWEVRTAEDGPGALKAAREFQPDVVLLDIGLPGLDGYEVARQIRQDPALKHIVLIALTGYGQASDRGHSREAGFDHHLVKPVDFTSTVRQLLQSIAEAGTL